MVTVLVSIWHFIRGDMSASEFEHLVYDDQALEVSVGRDLYLDLLAADFRDAQVVVGVQGRLWEWLIATHPHFAVETYGYQTEPWHTVRLFPATCQTCGHEFAVPVLSDFAYGEFILSTQSGNRYAYLAALANLVWDEIATLYDRLAKIARETGGPTVDQLHRVIAECADPIGGENLQIGYRCPNCQAPSIRFHLAAPLDDAAIPVASFRGFIALSEAGKTERVRALVMPDRG